MSHLTVHIHVKMVSWHNDALTMLDVTVWTSLLRGGIPNGCCFRPSSQGDPYSAVSDTSLRAL